MKSAKTTKKENTIFSRDLSKKKKAEELKLYDKDHISCRKLIGWTDDQTQNKLNEQTQNNTPRNYFWQTFVRICFTNQRIQRQVLLVLREDEVTACKFCL